ALNDVAPDVSLAGADVDHVGIGGGDRDRADRRVVNLAVGDRLPRDSCVGRLPETAAGRAHVVLVRPHRAAGHRDRAAAARGSETAPAERAEPTGAGGW